MLDDPDDLFLLHQAAHRFANANVPAPVLAAERLGRFVALRTRNGCVRAFVVGDVFRRLSLAPWPASTLPERSRLLACRPYPFGLSTSAGCAQAPRHSTSSSRSPLTRTTVLSVDVASLYGAP